MSFQQMGAKMKKCGKTLLFVYARGKMPNGLW
jgi:hypothetical protein